LVYYTSNLYRDNYYKGEVMKDKMKDKSLIPKGHLPKLSRKTGKIINQNGAFGGRR
jgi:hypothetical protein